MIITDMKTEINKVTETNHKDTYELERVTVSKESRKISGTVISRISNLGMEGSSESDLVSDKMKKIVICTIVIQSR